jgi:uncharacterized membrane protein
MSLLIALHVLAAVVWVGGMFFAYMVLRPSAGPLEPSTRLALWRRVFARFFPWVWASIIVLLASGYAMMFAQFGGFAGAPLHVNVMQATGILMMLLFMHLFFAPWRRFSRAVDAGTWADAAASLGQIRVIVAVNLALGLLTVALASSGRFWA